MIEILNSKIEPILNVVETEFNLRIQYFESRKIIIHIQYRTFPVCLSRG